MKNNKYLELNTLEQRFKELLKKQRKQRNLTQLAAADLFYKSLSAYQRWESGKCLPSIHDLADIVEKFHVPISDIMELLGIPSLTADELKNMCPDEDTLKNIKDEGFYLYARKNCADINDLTVKNLAELFFTELLKRYSHK